MPAIKPESSILRGCGTLCDWGAYGFPEFGMSPVMYTSARDELLACRSTAWLGSFLTTWSPVYDVSGPDAVELLNRVTVNRDYALMKVGGSRHALLCNDAGQLLADGVLMRISEDTYRTYWLAPVISYYVDTLGLDVTGTYVDDEYFFQIDGPKSLQIMEKATQTDLHELKFAQHKDVQIAGTAARVHRLGMSGCLAYEFHGDMADADKVWDAVTAAGEQFGLKRLGHMQYCENHTQGGYPNQWIQFWYPRVSSGEALADYVRTAPGFQGYNRYRFAGSAGQDFENPVDTPFVTPYDLDWDYLINWDHEFVGKETLEKIAEKPARKCVTLEWNAEDVGKVYAAQFMGEADLEADDITPGVDAVFVPFTASKVYDGDELVGVATGRSHDYYHYRMISLAFIDRERAQQGGELTVVWGTPGTHQMEVRATIAPFPYYDEHMRNETFDVNEIPRLDE